MAFEYWHCMLHFRDYQLIESTLAMLADSGCWGLWYSVPIYKVRFSKIGRSPLGQQTGFSPEQDRQGGIASVHSTQPLLTSASRLVADISRLCVSSVFGNTRVSQQRAPTLK